MRPLTAVLLTAFFALVPVSHGEEETVAKSASGRFHVTQEYHGDFVEMVRFRDPAHPAVQLLGLNWPGLYSVSPDERWLLRTQKVGSGESQAMLYRIEENGWVSEVVGFDAMLWSVSDKTSRLKKKDLYHTGIDGITWAKDNGSVEIVLSGSNASESGDGIECRISYDLKTHRAVIRKDPK